jgi:hypothetical protein
VHARTQDEGLAPRVEDAQESDRRAEMARVGRDLEQRRRTGLEQQGVHEGGIVGAQRQERVRQRKDDVHVRHVEEFAFTRRQPPLAGLRLALGTVPIATRIVRDGPMPAGAALIEMAAERGRPTPAEGAQDGALLDAQPRMLLDEVSTLRVEDIGHLHGGPAHGCGGLRKIRE